MTNPKVLAACSCLAFAGCAHTGAYSTDDASAPLHYTFTAANTVVTSLREPDGQEVYAGSVPSVSLRWDGTIVQTPTRRFRDGSQGDRVRLLDVSFAVDSRSPLPSELSGLSVELRSFGDREILAIEQFDHLVGWPRGADLAVALWPALSPEVPELDLGEPARQRSNLPLMLGTGMGIPVALDLHWTLVGTTPCGASTCWQLDYEGPVSGRGLERGETSIARYRLSGTAMGTLLLAEADNAIVDSSLKLDLQLFTTISDPHTGVPRGVIEQRHQQHAQITAKPEAG